MRTRAQAAEPTALDVPYIAEAFTWPEADVQSLLDAPTAELVRSFLQSIQTKAQEHDALKTDKLRVDVELDSIVRSNDTKAKAQKAQLTKYTKEMEELRKKLDESETTRRTLASELDYLRSNASDSTAEVQTLRRRIESLEGSNRDLLALVEKKSTEKDQVATELSQQLNKLMVLKTEVRALEEKNQNLEHAASSQRFKEQSLQQEIDLLKKNNEWQSSELEARNQEQVRFRKERSARLASLQREFEDATATVEALKRTESTLRQRLDDMQVKADEAFARIASMQEDAARKDRDRQTEVNSTKRLAELQAQNAATHKARVSQIQEQMERLSEDARQEIGQLQAEIETERAEKDAAERKVAELEITVERLEQNRPVASRPGTPLRNGAFDPVTPGRVGSRPGSPIPGSLRKVVGGLSFTQLYSKYSELQSELEAERRRTNKLTETLDELVAEMEGRQPELLEMRADQERLEGEVLDYSRLLDQSKAKRDEAVKDSQRWQGQAENAIREANILKQQVRDISAQVKLLLVEIQSRDQGLGEMSSQERLELERAARGDFSASELAHMTDTDRFVNERLVLFRDVAELQQRNQQLLTVTRTLGERMEGEEAREKERQTAADHEELEYLRTQVGRYKDELHATATQIDSYMKERDMFRRMLQHRGTLHPEADLQSLFGQSVGPSTTPMRNGQHEPETPRSKDVQDLHTLLKEHQTSFDQFRTEALTDRKQLKDQVDKLSHEKSLLQGDIAKAQSQLQLASERYDMLQQNYQASRNENVELQKRSSQLYQQLTVQETKTNQVAEDLVEARSMTESLRNENANAKAEKELWKRIEARLTEDNKSLMDERARLNKLVTDMQNLQNERDFAEAENRRRWQSRAEELETELKAAKKRADNADEEYMRLTQRREYEEIERKKREDDLTKGLANVREELIAAKTTRDSLQSRVDELKTELRSAEDKVLQLQPQPTPHVQAREQNGDSEEDIPAEQRLALEVSELRETLEHVQNQLLSAGNLVEQFRVIAQSSEEELASFTETSEQYKEETDRIIAEKDSLIKELQQRIEEISTELSNTNAELSEIRTTQENAAQALEDQRGMFESEIARLRDDVNRFGEEKKLYQGDLRAQAEIAQQAQQSYEDELVKHADAAKNLQEVRKQYHELRAEIANYRSEAESARLRLDNSEDSWREREAKLEGELEEVRRRKIDADEQNRLLHQQMESFSSELQALRQGRVLPAGSPNENEADSGTPASDSSNLQEVIRFLRREKEIVDVQYELSVQDGKRLQQQLDYTNTQLEDVRQKLAEERRQATGRLLNENSTSKLMEEIKQLNLYRESNESLRNSLKQSEEKLKAARSEVERLIEELQQLKSRAGELEGELEGKQDELNLLQDDRDHWRERTNTIISKYGRVEPAELEEMRTKIEELQQEKDRLLQEKEALEAEAIPLREQVDGIDSRVEEAVESEKTVYNGRLDRFKEQAKEQNRKQNVKITELTNQATQAKAEVERLKVELEQAVKKQDELASKAISKDLGEGSVEEGQIEEGESGGAEHAQLHARIAEAEASAAEHADRAQSLQQQIQILDGRVKELEAQVVSQHKELETAQEAAENMDAGTETLQKLQQDLSEARTEIERLHADATAVAAQSKDTQPAEGETSFADRVANEIAKLRAEMEQQHELSKKQMEEDFQTRRVNLRDQLNTKLREAREKANDVARSELQQQHSEELQKLRDEHAAAMEKLKQDHQAEVDRLAKEGATAAQKAAQVDLSALDFSNVDITDDQARQFVQHNKIVKRIVTNNVNKRVEDATRTLQAQIDEKNAEIARLEAAQTKPEASENGADVSKLVSELEAVKAERDDLVKKLEQANASKQKAIDVALDQREKKLAVQLSMRDQALAKVNAIIKAYNETPEKTVKEVWDVAKNLRAAPKTPTVAKPATPSSPAILESPRAPPPEATDATAISTAAPPAVATPKAEDEAAQKIQQRQERVGMTTRPAEPPRSSETEVPPAAGTVTTNDEAERIQKRQERFGMTSPVQGTTPTNYGDPNALNKPVLAKPSFGQSSFGQSSFGQPSFGQPSGLTIGSNSYNPRDPAFTPGANLGTQGHPHPAPQGSGIPRVGSGIPRPGGSDSRDGNQGMSIQGAAGRNGGHQSGIPRGGQSGYNRGGRGQKRHLDGGGDGGGDYKRNRGGSSGQP